MKLMLKNKTISYFAPGMAVIVSAYSFAMAWENFVRIYAGLLWVNCCELGAKSFATPNV